MASSAPDACSWEPGTAVAADGTPLAFWSAGSGSPVLLIAGQAVDHHSWDLVAPRLVAAHRLVAFDHRGTGKSGSGPATRFSTRDLADDARAVLDAAGVDRAHVVGHSMGGRIAQWLAVDRPERVDRLVLVATTAGDRHGPPRDTAADAALRSGDFAALARLFFADAWEPAAFARLFAVGGSAVDRGRHFRASRGHDSLAELASVRARTLVLHGADDLLTAPGHARVLADALPHARLMVVPDARHGVVLDGGAGVDLVAEFLAGSEVSAGGGPAPS